MSDETTLLPCPFCGGEAELTTFGLSWEPLVYGVRCIADAKRGFDAHGHQIAGFGSAEKAIAAWNNRATHSALTAEQVMSIAGKHQPDYCSDTHVCFDWQAIADELNAALGGGECELIYGETDEGMDSWFTQCGGRFAATFENGRMVHPKLCLLCGKAVKR